MIIGLRFLYFSDRVSLFVERAAIGPAPFEAMKVTDMINKDKYANVLGQKLSVLRAALKCTQMEMSELLGITRASYVSYEKMERDIPWSRCLAIHQIFSLFPETKMLLRVYGLTLNPENLLSTKKSDEE
jgi:DNA-binding XRE family transcriptional regulator